jgi:hypothetical protein
MTNEEKLESLKDTHRHLVFLNQKMLSITFYLEEMKMADEAMRWITAFGNNVGRQIDELTPKEEPVVESSEEAVIEASNE